MEIRFSKYNEPFVEPSTPGVHYISLDDQRDMWAGIYDAHVKLYRLQPVSQVFEVVDHLRGVTHVFTSAGPLLKPFSSSPVSMPVELDFLDDLFYKSGIKAAGKLSGRIASPATFRQKSRGDVCN